MRLWAMQLQQACHTAAHTYTAVFSSHSAAKNRQQQVNILRTDVLYVTAVAQENCFAH
jgi:hypothetical protein